MLRPDTTLQGRYQVVRLIGRGGMGAVYEAFDSRLEVFVALKQTIVTAAAGRALTREARILATLRHPVLPVVTDYFAEEGSLFLVMQLFPGDDLATLIAARGAPFPLAEVRGWAGQILDALAYLHGRRPPVVHRDIKPHNLKPTPEGGVVLLDFGLAKSATESIKGYTARYAPPEQIHGDSTDARSDLFALGATLYHLLVGRPPPNAIERFNARLAGMPDPLDLTLVPEAAAAPLAAALALDPSARPGRAEDLGRLLGAPAAPAPPPGPTPRPAPPAEPRPTVLLEPRRHNLPAWPIPLVGRAADLAAALGLLRDGQTRLLTLTGAPGVGKTRLACELARAALDEEVEQAVFVPLDEVRSPGDLLPTIGAALGLGRDSSAQTLATGLGGRPTLLLLDTFEHLLPAGVEVAALLAAAPRLRVLVTSRACLRLRAEQEYPVAPLGAPPAGLPAPDVAALAAYPAVELFVRQAGAAQPGFALTTGNAPAVAAICASLDGLPLALVLAAGRVRSLPPALIQSRLARRLDLLAGGPRDLAPRSRSMRAALAWSFDLLQPDEQIALGAAASFAGPFTLDAAEAVLAAALGGRPDALGLLESLAAQHLLSHEGAAEETHFRMLGVIRDYGLEKFGGAGGA